MRLRLEVYFRSNLPRFIEIIYTLIVLIFYGTCAFGVRAARNLGACPF